MKREKRELRIVRDSRLDNNGDKDIVESLRATIVRFMFKNWVRDLFERRLRTLSEKAKTFECHHGQFNSRRYAVMLARHIPAALSTFLERKS
jgi:hypothetical protein